MNGAIFKVPGTWEAGLFEMTPAFYPDAVKAKEVSEPGYARIPITAAWVKVLPNIMDNKVTWYFSSPGGRWKVRRPGMYRCYVLRNGEGVTPLWDITPIIGTKSTIGFDAMSWTLEKLRKEA